MRIILVRHGESEGNKKRIVQGHKDFPLSEEGRAQAKTLAKYIVKNNYQFSKIYSSDLIRARETAEIIAKSLHHKEIISDSRLREFNLGIFQGKANDDMTSEDNGFLQKCWKDHSLRVPEGENVLEMKARIKDVFDEIVETNSENSHILIVGHGGSLYHILDSTLGIFPKTDEWFENCSFNVIEKQSSDDQWKLLIFNGKKVN
ncbi:MAG: histidine phosphatase family protein [Candidatus Thorarchaeota archaeon]